MLFPEIPDLVLNLCNVISRLLNGSPAVPLTVPPIDILAHFPYAAFLLAHLITQFTGLRLKAGVVDQFQATRLAGAVFLVALLAEVPPLPVPTSPPCLVKVAHVVGVVGVGDDAEWVLETGKCDSRELDIVWVQVLSVLLVLVTAVDSN